MKKEGGAAIADRFRLDAPVENKSAVGGPALVAAFCAGLLALGVAGYLTYVLWEHWKYLMPA